MSNFTLLGCLELVKKFVWVGGWVVSGLEGNFSVSYGPKLLFRLWIWTCTKLNNKLLLKSKILNLDAFH